jgi:hypothetical protein
MNEKHVRKKRLEGILLFNIAIGMSVINDINHHPQSPNIKYGVDHEVDS